MRTCGRRLDGQLFSLRAGRDTSRARLILAAPTWLRMHPMACALRAHPLAGLGKHALAALGKAAADLVLLVNQTSLIVAVVERGVRGGAHKHHARDEADCCGAKVRVQHDIAVCLQCGSTL